jgi:hypothetical protein
MAVQERTPEQKAARQAKDQEARNASILRKQQALEIAHKEAAKTKEERLQNREQVHQMRVQAAQQTQQSAEADNTWASNWSNWMAQEAIKQ